MSIMVSHNISTLNTQRFLESKTAKIRESVEQVKNGNLISRDNDNAVDFKVSEELHTNIRTLVTIENLGAADSTIRKTGIAKEIAILTRNHILEMTSATMTKQNNLRS